MNYKIILALITIISIITSCGKDDAEIRREQIKEIEEKINNFAIEYNAEFDLDTMEYKYTLDFQNLAMGNYKLLSKDFYMHDILYESGKYYITGKSSGKGYNYFHYKLICPKTKIKSIRQNYNRHDNLSLIYSLKDISKLRLQVEADCRIEEYGDDDFECESYITIEDFRFTDEFIVNGELIDFLIIKE